MEYKNEGGLSFLSRISPDYELKGVLRTFSLETKARSKEKDDVETSFMNLAFHKMERTSLNYRISHPPLNKILKMPSSLKNPNFAPFNFEINFPRRNSQMNETDKAFVIPVMGLKELEVKKNTLCKEKYLKCEFCPVTINRKRLPQIVSHYISHIEIWIEEFPNWTENLNQNNFVSEIFEATHLKISPEQITALKDQLLARTCVFSKRVLLALLSLRCPLTEKTFLLCGICNFIGNCLDDIKTHLKGHVLLIECLATPTVSLCLTEDHRNI